MYPNVLLGSIFEGFLLLMLWQRDHENVELGCCLQIKTGPLATGGALVPRQPNIVKDHIFLSCFTWNPSQERHLTIYYDRFHHRVVH
jgi:hypothetical protein